MSREELFARVEDSLRVAGQRPPTLDPEVAEAIRSSSTMMAYSLDGVARTDATPTFEVFKVRGAERRLSTRFSRILADGLQACDYLRPLVERPVAFNFQSVGIRCEARRETTDVILDFTHCCAVVRGGNGRLQVAAFDRGSRNLIRLARRTFPDDESLREGCDVCERWLGAGRP